MVLREKGYCIIYVVPKSKLAQQLFIVQEQHRFIDKTNTISRLLFIPLLITKKNRLKITAEACLFDQQTVRRAFILISIALVVTQLI